MTQIKQDKYMLSQSIDKKISLSGENIRLDLKVEPKVDSFMAIITGKVVDAIGNPIYKALVLLSDKDNNPLVHVITDNYGNYMIKVMSISSSYNIMAIAEGKKLYQQTNIIISNAENKIINLKLENDPSASMGIISGSLREEVAGIPIKNGTVSLYNQVNGEDILSAVTHTNDYGQYIFTDVKNGNYKIRFTASNYNQREVVTSLSAGERIVSLTYTLTPVLSNTSNNTSLGTVSGVITDNLNKPVDNADVILYRVEANGNLTPIDFTKTNQYGSYLFINVAVGNYEVMCNEYEVIDNNIPTVGEPLPQENNNTSLGVDKKASIIRYISTATTTTLAPLIYGAEVFDPSGGAHFDINTGCMKGIGKNSTGGNGKFNVTADVEYGGNYDLNIKYIPSFHDNVLMLSISGNINKSYSIILPKKESWEEVEYKTVQVSISLESYRNFMVFSGDGVSSVPDISEIQLRAISYSKNIPLEDLKLTDRAWIDDKAGTKVIDTSYGGRMEYATNIEFDGLYTLEIEYLTSNSRAIFEYAVDGVKEQNLNTNLPKTNSMDLKDASSTKIYLNLSSGYRVFNFYGGVMYNWGNPEFHKELYIISLKLNKEVYSKSEPLQNIRLTAPATINANGFIEGVGGDEGGTATVYAYPLYDGKYQLLIGYNTLENKSITVLREGAPGELTDIKRGEMIETKSLEEKDMDVLVMDFWLKKGYSKFTIK